MEKILNNKKTYRTRASIATSRSKSSKPQKKRSINEFSFELTDNMYSIRERKK